MSEPGGPPSEKHQKPVLFAFRKIVVTQRTRNGRVWYPGRILEELWELWPDRPKEAGAKKRFLDEHVQRIGRLRRGVTLGFVRDPLLFHLIEKFVEKHARPGEIHVAFSLVALLHRAAQSILEFLPHSREDGVSQPAVDGHTPEHNEMLMWDVIDTPHYDGMSSLPGGHVLSLAFSDISQFGRRYSRAILFDRHTLRLEIGFSIPELNLVFLRPVVAGVLNRANPESSGLLDKPSKWTYRTIDFLPANTDILRTGQHDSIAWNIVDSFEGERSAHANLTSMHLWPISNIDARSVREFAATQLNFLDI